MSVKSIQIHDAERDGAAMYSYGDGEFKINSTNSLAQSASHINSTDHGWTATGADIDFVGFTTDLPEEFLEDNAEIVNRGVIEVEWTGGGSDESVGPSPQTCQVLNGETVDFGAWVYLESSNELARNITLTLDSYDGASRLFNEGTVQQSVTPGEWTLVTASITVSTSTADNAKMLIHQDGNQSVGDRMYIGMAFMNVDEVDAFPRPSTLMDEQFKLTTKLQQIGGTSNAGTIAQSLTGGWQVNTGFDGNYATINYVNNVGGNAYSVTSGIELDVERVYELEVLHVYSTGLFEIASFEAGRRRVLYSETLTTTTGSPALDNYGLDVMSGNWAVLYELAIYDSVGVEVEAPPAKNRSVYTDQVTHLDTPISIEQQAASKNNLIFDKDMFEVSRNFTGSVGFSIPKADRPEVDFSGDFFIACGFQTRNDQEVEIVGSHSGTEGWRLSTVAGTSPAQEWQAEFNDGTGNINEQITTIVNDGEYHFIGFQREAGVEYNIYSDDFDTPAASPVDTLGSLDGASTLDILSEWQGGFGALVVFTRMLTEEEHDEIGDWFEYGAQHDGAPDFIEEAAVYINPNSEVQKNMIRDRKLINLAHRPQDELWVRYGLTSDDGVDNPRLSSVHLEIPDLLDGPVAQKSVGRLEFHEGWLLEESDGLDLERSMTERELDGVDWTFLTVFTKTSGDNEQNIFSDATWRLYYDGTSLIFEQDSVTVDTTVQALEAGKVYLVTLKRNGSNVEVSVSGSTVSTFTVDFTNVTPRGIRVGENFHGVVHIYSLFERYLRPDEESEIMAVLEDSLDWSESIQISESFDYVELNWG